MEQKPDSQVRVQASQLVRLSEYGQFASFAAFMGFCLYFFFLAFGTFAQSLFYAALAIGIPLYAAGLKFTSLRLTSAAWFILGSFLIVCFVAINPSTTTFSLGTSFILFALVVLLIAFYEQTRFSFAIDPLVRIGRNLEEESLARLARVIRNHTLTLLQVVALSLLASTAVVFLAESTTIIVNPPLESVPILVSLAILAIVSVSLSFMRSDPNRREERE